MKFKNTMQNTARSTRTRKMAKSQNKQWWVNQESTIYCYL